MCWKMGKEYFWDLKPCWKNIVIFDIKGACINCARNKILGIYSYIVIISY